MKTTLRLSLRSYEQLTGWGAAFGLVLMLVGCGAPEGSARAVPEASARAVQEGPMRRLPVEVGVPGARARRVATSDAPPIITPVLPTAEPSPFELVGTSISAASSFAVLRETDQSVLTVREGDRIDGYTIAAIAPDRVKVRSPDNNEQLLMLLAATGNTGTRAGAMSPEPVASTALITTGINTDQSIPEHVTFGPTARLPEGMKQVGH